MSSQGVEGDLQILLKAGTNRWSLHRWTERGRKKGGVAKTAMVKEY